MPEYTLKNQEIAVRIDSLGAELKSLKDNRTGQEYMWCADPKYWKRTSPILFPLVGAYRNNETRYQGRTYSLPQHGFARDMEFELKSRTDTAICFSLKETQETLSKYPFAFRLELAYALKGREVEVSWRVENPSGEEMYFSIGGHPAFNCPLEAEEKQTDYSIEFDVQDKVESRLLGPEGVLEERKTYPLKEGRLAITEHLFDGDALIIENHQAHRVSLVNPEGRVYLSVAFEAPLFGIWSPPGKNAPFVCIEPWYGRADGANFDADITKREWGNRLDAGEIFEACYRITV